MSGNEGLEALEKLENTIIKILEFIMKMLDQKKLKDQIEKLQAENEKLRKQLEGKDGKEGDKSGISISQGKKKIAENEKKIEGLENALATVEHVEEMVNDPEKKEIKAMAQNAFSGVESGKYKNLQDAVLGEVKAKVGNGLDARTMGGLIMAARVQAQELNREGVDDGFGGKKAYLDNFGLQPNDMKKLEEFVAGGCKESEMARKGSPLRRAEEAAKEHINAGHKLVAGSNVYQKDGRSGEVTKTVNLNYSKGAK